MIIVPDNNILISGLLWKGNPRKIINLAYRKKVEFYGSKETYEEFCRVVTYPRFKKALSREIFTPQRLIIDYKSIIKIVPTSRILVEVNVVKKDPDDDIFFRVAKASKAKIIVSGDPHLLEVKKYDDIRVVEPVVFLEIFPKLLGKLIY